MLSSLVEQHQLFWRKEYGWLVGHLFSVLSTGRSYKCLVIFLYKLGTKGRVRTFLRLVITLIEIDGSYQVFLWSIAVTRRKGLGIH